jgi:hypothetical protein
MCQWYDVPVQAGRLLFGILYASYLANVGLFLVTVPWSSAWRRAVMTFPPGWTTVLDAPAFKGVVTGVGVVHLLLLAFELVVAIRALSEAKPLP